MGANTMGTGPPTFEAPGPTMCWSATFSDIVVLKLLEYVHVSLVCVASTQLVKYQ